MKHTIHTLSGFFSALSFLLSLFPMAGLDGDYQPLCIQTLIALFAITLAWYLVYAVTGANSDWH